MRGLGEFRLESYLARWEFKARHNLTASDVESCSLSQLLELATAEQRAQWEELSLGYLPSEGSSLLREAIAATYEGLQSDQVLCFSGAQEGLYCALQALLSPGDHVLVTVPNYQSMEEIPRQLCQQVEALPLMPEHGWSFDPEVLERRMRPNTRLVAVNFPNNPTGALPTPEVWHHLIQCCRRRGIWLFSDEVYRGLERDPARRLPQAAEAYERGLSLNVLSKAYGLPGLRVGWIACPQRELLSSMLKLKHYLSICNAGPSEFLASLALHHGTRLLARNRALVEANLGVLEAFFGRHSDRFDWSAPPGGCVAFPAYLGGDVEDWCQRLVEDHGLLFLPASIYRSPLACIPENRFRVGFGRRSLSQGLTALEQVLSG